MAFIHCVIMNNYINYSLNLSHCLQSEDNTTTGVGCLQNSGKEIAP